MPLTQRTASSECDVLTKPIIPIVLEPAGGTIANNGRNSPTSSSNHSDGSSETSICDDSCQFYDHPDAMMTQPMMMQKHQDGDNHHIKSPLVLKRRQRKRKMKRRLFLAMVFVTAIGLVSSVLGLPFPDRSLPLLEPLPKNPTRAFATLHSDSNPCYDMLLYVCVNTWKDTDSRYPLLLLHSVPLPPRVQQLIDAQQQQFRSPINAVQSNHEAQSFERIQQKFKKQKKPQQQSQQQQQRGAGMVIPVAIPAHQNYFVLKDRVRTAAAKFAVWDQTAFDQVAYHDSDTVFFENGDSIFDAPEDNQGDLWLYAQPYTKYWNRGLQIFNSGKFLVRPSKAVYRKILDLFQRRFWILSFQQFLKTADQGFLNAVFPYEKTWNFLEDSKLNRVKHVKFWLAMAGETNYNITARDKEQANQMADDMNLHEELEICLHHQRYSV